MENLHKSLDEMRVIWLWNTHLCASRWVIVSIRILHRERRRVVLHKCEARKPCEHSRSSRRADLNRTRKNWNPFSSFNTREQKRWRAMHFEHAYLDLETVLISQPSAVWLTFSCLRKPLYSLLFEFQREFYLIGIPHAWKKRINRTNKCMGNWFFLSCSWTIVSSCRTVVTDYMDDSFGISSRLRKDFWIRKWFGNWIDDAFFMRRRKI